MRKSRNRQSKRKAKPSYVIIVDGKTEMWYFQMMKRHEDLSHITIKPELPKKKKLVEQFEKVKEDSAKYDYVFWLVDFDVLTKEDKERKKGTNSIIQNFHKYCKELQKKKYSNVQVFVNNPCLEFWYLLHHKASGKFYAECSAAEKELKKHISDYKKSQTYHTSNNDIYKRLKPLQLTALKNAKNLGDFSFEHTQEAKAEIYKILELLLPTSK